jgi:signal transduction histidine kinase
MAETAGGHETPHGVGAADDATDHRLGQLLQATTSVVERLDLEVVLRRIVESGMRLVGARYGALGVIGVDGTLERFIHVGVDRSTAARIGHLPEGRGVLGAVISGARPLRIDDLAADERAVGFPEHHPEMHSFLGVPVRVGAEVYGNLYLADSLHGTFSSGDEDLVTALAATAGIAIENARLYDISRTRERWNATIADVMAAMLDVSGEGVIDVIAEHVASLIDADLVAVAVPSGDDDLTLAVVYGTGAEALRGRSFPSRGTLSGRALAERQAVSITGQAGAQTFGWEQEVGPTVAIPLFTGDEPLGVLTISRRGEDPLFTPADLEMAFAFAAQASIALEIVRAREDRRRIEIARDRSRIARDLHDHVIQRLFGAGLALQSVSPLAGEQAAATIETQIDAIDAAIKDIRTIIFALSGSERRGPSRLRDRLLNVVAEATGSWTTPPRVSFDGPLDTLVDPALADDLVAALRELLTNVSKHADASRVQVTVAIDSARVRLIVHDDGRGFSGTQRRSGLANLADRAAAREGRCTVTSDDATGTQVEWTATIAEVGS